jgi:hypothetical protein
MFYVVLLIAAAVVGFAGLLMWQSLQASPRVSMTDDVRHARRRVRASMHRLRRSDRSAGWDFGTAAPGRS